MNDHGPVGLHLYAEPSDDGTYLGFVEVERRRWSLSRYKLRRYGHAVIEAAVTARYELSVYAELTEAGVPLDALLPTMAEFRRSRPPLDVAATSPLEFRPGITAKGTAFVHLLLDGELFGRVEPDVALNHGFAALHLDATTTLDTTFLKLLVEMVGLTEDQARLAVTVVGRQS